MHNNKNDFQHNNQVCITTLDNKDHTNNITFCNLIHMVIYLSVRHCIEATWLNDRDQFLYPNDGWQTDKEFQADCLAYTLFHGQNRITSQDGVNHWIPFTEKEVEPQNNFSSHFMTDYIRNNQIKFSGVAQDVFAAGRELWRYYHQQPNADPNAGFYDIRAYFQGKDAKGKMNKDSSDVEYTRLISELRRKQKVLAAKIALKVYEYGFLKE